MLKHRQTYEIMRPRRSARRRRASCSASTRDARRSRTQLAELGYCRSTATSSTASSRASRTLADKKKIVDRRGPRGARERRATRSRSTRSRSKACRSAAARIGMPTATVRLRGPDGQPDACRPRIGTGPVDAVFKAIDAGRAAARGRAARVLGARGDRGHRRARRRDRARCASVARGGSDEHPQNDAPPARVFHGARRRHRHHRGERQGLPRARSTACSRAQTGTPASVTLAAHMSTPRRLLAEQPS